jgi:hypothetical protein
VKMDYSFITYLSRIKKGSSTSHLCSLFASARCGWNNRLHVYVRGDQLDGEPFACLSDSGEALVGTGLNAGGV